MQFTQNNTIFAATYGFVDTLVNAVNFNGNSPLRTRISNIPRNYNCFLVNIFLLVGGPLYTVHCEDGNVIVAAPLIPVPTASSFYQAFVPLSANTGDTVDVFIFNGPGTNIQGTITIIGLTNGPDIPIRSEGRVYPSGSLAQTAVLSGSSGPINIVGTLTQGLRYIIKSANIGYVSPAAFVDIQTTIAGVPTSILSSGSGAIGVWDTGIVADQGVAITLVASVPTTVRANLIYDIIV